ncbi:helix-turn-helix domain-containing protein [Streptomyces sp. NPDC001663]|uniref:helix-turn-helix domain-containing protein n=1 Tax=Streptomyces sp. NPDC001663 TaxID=3364597 RepID=UPI003686C5AB
MAVTSPTAGESETGRATAPAERPRRFAPYRGFRGAYGFAPGDYRRDLRLRRTRALLAEGMAPSVAAAEPGFADQSHLTRWFTRIHGVTPAAYRTPLHTESRR